MNNFQNLKKIEFVPRKEFFLDNWINIIQISVDGEEYSFKVSNRGNFLPAKLIVPNLNSVISFEYDNSFVEIKSNVGQYTFGFYKFITLAKTYTLIKKNIFYKVHEDFKEFYNRMLVNSIKTHFNKEKFYNFLIEMELGSFEEGFLFDDFFIENVTERFFNTTNKFFTHIVGTKYYINSFDFADFQDEPVFLVWDSENNYDPNAVAVLDKNGRKIGFIRKTISSFLVKKFQFTPVLYGKVIYTDEKNIYIEVNI